jgi:serine protease
LLRSFVASDVSKNFPASNFADRRIKVSALNRPKRALQNDLTTWANATTVVALTNKSAAKDRRLGHRSIAAYFNNRTDCRVLRLLLIASKESNSRFPRREIIMILKRTSRPFALLFSFALALVGWSAAYAAPPQRLIVKYKLAPAAAGRALAETQTLTDAQGRMGVNLTRLHFTANGADVLRVDRELTGTEIDSLVSMLRSNPNVEYAEEDRILKAYMTPNDPRYNEQWHYYESTAGINAPAAWDTATGTGVTVAVIDTGYRPHADLAANIVGGYDFISDTTVANDGDGRDSDARDPGDWTDPNECRSGDPAFPSSWHGTHVAGTIAGLTNNSTGVAGIAFNAKILPVRVLGRCGGFTSDIADGIVWASGGSVSGVPANANPARVINMSLGGTGACSTTLQNAINTARGRGTTVIVAAGNENRNASNDNPGNCSGVVVVAAVNRSGNHAWYSNFGTIVDVAAPGGDTSNVNSNGVLSTLNAGTTTPGADAYAFYQGTSMATPHVVGIAALMLSVNSSLTPDQVESLLKSTTRAFPGTCSQCGTGIVDAAAAVAAAAGGGGGGGACPTGYTEFTGSLSGTGVSSYKPSTSGYTAAISGLHLALLSGPPAVDFDLYLQKRINSTWRSVASSLGTTASESINYSGTTGTYRWRVYAYNGSGSFSLCTKTP